MSRQRHLAAARQSGLLPGTAQSRAPRPTGTRHAAPTCPACSPVARGPTADPTIRAAVTAAHVPRRQRVGSFRSFRWSRAQAVRSRVLRAGARWVGAIVRSRSQDPRTIARAAPSLAWLAQSHSR
jgi:hypothetical protein